MALRSELIRVVLGSRQDSSDKSISGYTRPTGFPVTCRQIYFETTGLFITNCIIDISQIDNRGAVETALGSQRESMISILLNYRAIYRIMDGTWSQNAYGVSEYGPDLFPALERVHLHRSSVNSGIGPQVKSMSRHVFGKEVLELVYDHRAGTYG